MAGTVWALGRLPVPEGSVLERNRSERVDATPLFYTEVENLSVFDLGGDSR